MNDNDECRGCGAHIADPHAPGCPNGDELDALDAGESFAAETVTAHVEAETARTVREIELAGPPTTPPTDGPRIVVEQLDENGAAWRTFRQYPRNEDEIAERLGRIRRAYHMPSTRVTVQRPGKADEIIGAEMAPRVARSEAEGGNGYPRNANGYRSIESDAYDDAYAETHDV